ncbi:hypothetical protein KM043_000593 [Ampulex compressa]|nr:hypothetical protein KM043_000593 [Ampulex compressa]
MRIQERCFPLAVAGLCVLAGLAPLSSRALELEPRINATPDSSGDVVPGVQPLRAEPRNEMAETKGEHPTKEAEIKTTTEAKKKPVVDFKAKPEQKYHKSLKEEETARGEPEILAMTTSTMTAMTMSRTTPTPTPTPIPMPMPTMTFASTLGPTSDTTTDKSKDPLASVLLLRGAPIVSSTSETTERPGDASVGALERASSTEEIQVTEESGASRGRALNITAPEPTNSLHANLTDLSDVSMDDDDKEVEGGEYVASRNETSSNVSSSLLPAVYLCMEKNRTYAEGERVLRGCEEECRCGQGGVVRDCKPVCLSPYVRAGRGIDDPLCQEKLVSEEPCCAILVCAADSAPEPEESCAFGNKTVSRGQRLEDGCARICVCEAGGILKCQPRCPPNETTAVANQHDRCVALTDPRDSCCTITLCDVTLGDHEIKTESSTELSVNLTDVKVLNSTAIKLKLSAKNPRDVTIEISDNNHVWRQQKPDKDGIVSTLEPAHTYYVRVTEGGRSGPAIQVFLPAEVVKSNISDKSSDKNSCAHRGKTYKVGAEWYDECISFCVCAEGGKTECVTIECPTDFGLDVLDPHCLDWETVPPNFVPRAPHCCPQEVRCRNNGSCGYEGKTYENWSELPTNVTGCEKRCYCEMGNVSCQAACPPPEKGPPPPPKEKIRSKSDSKKPLEPGKPHKEPFDRYFPGPLAPDKFPARPAPPLAGPIEPDEPPASRKPADQPRFVPLHPQRAQPDPGSSFVPANGEHIPPGRFEAQELEEPAVGPPYRGPVPLDPNVILPALPKKKLPQAAPAGRPKQSQREPEREEILPDELYRLINLQHPGLVRLESGPPTAHPALYELHRQITGQKRPANDRGQPSHLAAPPAVPKKVPKPHVYAQKGENGQTIYHVHAPNVPDSPRRIEELLAHIGRHDSNPGPFQTYPGQPPLAHDPPNGPPPTPPLRIDAHVPHSGLTHLNHPFAAQTPNQSGMEHGVPHGFPIPGDISGFPVASSSDEVSVQILEALDENTVRLVFAVPQLLVGLHGRVELRYTSDKTNYDVSSWKVQVFAPPNDLIATPQLEFELGDLKPATEYKVKITVKLKDLANAPTSKIYSVRTLEKRAEVTTLPPQIPIDAELRAMETNSSWVDVTWKKFTEYELQFIDGVQLRYKEHDGKVYAATPLIHRAVTDYVIENLKPSTTYEVGIYFIPFPGQLTELISEKTIQITTSTEPDPYSFDVKVEIKTVKSTDVEVAWSGVPYPEDKYVNIYRAIYQSDSGKEDTSTFKIAKRDSHARTMISELKPGTRYRLWLEVYLTNGRIKKSNVQDFVTKPGILLPATVSQQAGKLATLPLHEGDYYGPLVVVAIVASLAILSTLILLMMLMKRRTSSKADISPRKTTSAYDNPSYKVELQQETMDL